MTPQGSAARSGAAEPASPGGATPPWGRADLGALLALTLLWAATALWLGVHGDFPVSDDWAYARATQALLETGRIERVGWTFVPLVTNALLGAGFAALFGFSFETLRAANLFAAWLLLLASYALVRELGGTWRHAGFGAALVAWCPLTLVLAFTWMSDVVFAACVAGSLACGVRGLRRERAPALVASLGLALAASLSRHFGLALLVAIPAVALLGRPSRALRATALSAAAAMGVLFALALALLYAGGDTGRLAGPGRILEELREPWLLHKLARNGLATFTYLGVFLAPAALWRTPAPRGGRVALGAAALAAAILAAVSTTRLRMPFTVDVVNPSWLGWISLRGVEALPPAPPAFWWAVAAVGLGAGLYLAMAVGRELARAGPGRWTDPRLLLLAFPALYLAVLWVRSPFFDRYLLPLLPALAALALVPRAPRREPGRLRPVALVALLGLAAAGLAGTRDNLAHHRARWSLLEPLQARGISARCIDGGFELGGWLAYDPERRHAPRRFVHDDAWLLTLDGPRPGYEVVDARDYRRLLPWRRERILLLRRTGAPCHVPETSRPADF